MAKTKGTHNITLFGELDVSEGTITEYGKESIDTYSLENTLKRFDKKEVTITIKENKDLPTVDME